MTLSILIICDVSLFDQIASNQLKTKSRREAWTKEAEAHVADHTWHPQKNSLPAPLLCDSTICRPAVKPTCRTMIQPQYNSAGSLKKALVGVCLSAA